MTSRNGDAHYLSQLRIGTQLPDIARDFGEIVVELMIAVCQAPHRVRCKCGHRDQPKVAKEHRNTLQIAVDVDRIEPIGSQGQLPGSASVSVYVVVWDNVFEQNCPVLHSVYDSIPIGTPGLIVELVGLDGLYSHAGRWIIRQECNDDFVGPVLLLRLQRSIGLLPLRRKLAIEE